jgi:hypothetical protein
MSGKPGVPIHPRRALRAIPVGAAILLFAAAGARADIGFESASRAAAAPGDPVRVTVGCGFCLPHCVGEPGERHPPGRGDGACMLGHRSGPPASFPVWLTASDTPLEPHRCGPRMLCPPESARPPRLPSFVHLGRAAHRGESPHYDLRFRVPDVPAGAYKYVLYCDTCVDGPRGNLLESSHLAAGRLRVLTESDPDRPGPRPWIVGGLLAAIAVPGAGLLARRRRAR